MARAAYLALERSPGGADYSALLEETAHEGGDPLRAASAASERHDEIVRKLDVERSQRDEAEARRARLADALLYETPGSRIDVFARANRGTIELRLRRFGLAGADSNASFRDLVRDLSSFSATLFRHYPSRNLGLRQSGAHSLLGHCGVRPRFRSRRAAQRFGGRSACAQ